MSDSTIVKAFAPDPLDPGLADQALPISGSPVAGSGNRRAVLDARLFATSGAGGNTPSALVALPTNADNAPVSALNEYLGTIARLTGFDGTDWDRVRTTADTSGGPTQAAGVLITAARLQVLNSGGTSFTRVRGRGDFDDQQPSTTEESRPVSNARLYAARGAESGSWDRLRTSTAANLAMTLQGQGAVMVNRSAEWTAPSTPAVSVQATATRAAGGAGNRHIARSITVSTAGPAAQTAVDVYLRDGAAGVGTILWSGVLSFTLGGMAQITLSDLNIIGSTNTAMTLEFAAAPVATNFQRVTLTGYTATDSQTT